MTAERDGKSRRTGQPDLLASLPAERPPASQLAPGIDPASIEKLLTEMRDLRNDFAGLKEAVSAERPAPVTLDDLREQFAQPREAEPTEGPAPVTLEGLEAWGDKFVARVAEAARPADAPGDEAAATRTKRMEDAVAKPPFVPVVLYAAVRNNCYRRAIAVSSRHHRRRRAMARRRGRTTTGCK